MMFILFIVITPFTNINYFILIHAIVVPFLMIHWICNDNTCILTIIERRLRKEIYGTNNDDDCITCRLIEPIYDFRANYATFSVFIYGITTLLWLISCGVIVYKYKIGELNRVQDIFKINKN